MSDGSSAALIPTCADAPSWLNGTPQAPVGTPEWCALATDKIEGLTCDLQYAVQVAWRRGAKDWARLNYRGWVEWLEACDALESPSVGTSGASEPSPAMIAASQGEGEFEVRLDYHNEWIRRHGRGGPGWEDGKCPLIVSSLFHLAQDAIRALSAPQQAAPVGDAVEQIVGVSLRGQQGEPAGMMTVTAHMRDGSEVELIEDNGNVISHWKNTADLSASTLREACQRMIGDYQSSQDHHPDHVLVRRVDFDTLRQALAQPADSSGGEG